MNDPKIKLHTSGVNIYLAFEFKDGFTMPFYDICKNKYWENLPEAILVIGGSPAFAEWDNEGRFIRIVSDIEFIPSRVPIHGDKRLWLELHCRDDIIMLSIMDGDKFGCDIWSPHFSELPKLAQDALACYLDSSFAIWTACGQWAGLKYFNPTKEEKEASKRFIDDIKNGTISGGYIDDPLNNI